MNQGDRVIDVLSEGESRMNARKGRILPDITLLGL
jgi:hypothetical protein